MDELEDAMLFALRMGSSFEKALGNLIGVADTTNRQKILQAWPEQIHQLAQMWRLYVARRDE
jgi:hypothetical protein